MEETDGVLPLSVEYRAFQQMYSILQSGIQAGLLDVVCEVFSAGLIPPHTKNTVESTSIPEASRAGTLLSSLLQRTKTRSKTFSEFADVLDKIPSFQYLATDMRTRLAEVEKEDEKRLEEQRKEAEKQEHKRQELRIRINETKSTTTQESNSYPVTASSDLYTSPSYSTTRRIEGIPSLQSSPITLDHKTPQRFSDQVSLPSSTPGLGPGISPPPFFGKYTLDSTRPDIGNFSSPMTTQNHTTHCQPVSPTLAVSPSRSKSSPVKRTTEHPQVFPSRSASSSTLIPLSDIPNSTHAYNEHPPEDDQKTTISIPPSATDTTSEPNSPISTTANIHEQSPVDIQEETSVTSISTSFSHMKSQSSIDSACSHDVSLSQPSSLESESLFDCEAEGNEQKPMQEFSSVHSGESLVGVNPKKLHRSVSCEKCLKKKLLKMEKMMANLQLEHSREIAAYEVKTKRLLQESATYEPKMYQLECTVQQYKAQYDNAVQVNHGLATEIDILKEEVKKLKFFICDKTIALDEKRSEIHRCPSCNTIVSFPL